MIYISHRGLINGPNKKLENRPDIIIESLDKGYECEIDFWVIDNNFYLGHDEPQYNVNLDFIKMTKLWIHAKNLNAFYWLTQSNLGLNYFWHQTDDFTLTSNNYIWTYPGLPLTSRSVMVLPEQNDPNLDNLPKICYGVCSDFIEKIKKTEWIKNGD